MLIRMREDGSLISESQFKSLFPNTSFPPTLSPEAINDFGGDPVHEGPQPTGEPWQTAVMEGVEQVNGIWQTKYVLTPDMEPVGWLDGQKQAKLAVLADRRWRAEIGGVTWNGTVIATDRDSQTKITAAYLKASQDAGFLIPNWKVGSGVFTALDAATIISIGDTVTSHVQNCFDKEATLSAAILAAADITELAAIDIESGWPS